jgi:hypothetical protein
MVFRGYEFARRRIYVFVLAFWVVFASMFIPVAQGQRAPVINPSSGTTPACSYPTSGIVPPGSTDAFVVGLGNDAPSVPKPAPPPQPYTQNIVGWDIVLNGTVIATSSNPSGWNAIGNCYVWPWGTNQSIGVTVPTNAALSTSYEVRVWTLQHHLDDGMLPYPPPIIPLSACFGVGVPSNPLSLTVNPIGVQGGNNATGTVTLAYPAPTGGAVVTLASSDTKVAIVPASVTIPANSTSANFTILTNGLMFDQEVVTITAMYNGYQAGAVLTVYGNGNNSPGTLASLVVNPSAVIGGSPSSATVTLAMPAYAFGVYVGLGSSDPSTASLSQWVYIPPNQISATATINTVSVSSVKNITISASLRSTGGLTAPLTVYPCASATLASIAANPTSLPAGTQGIGTVTLNTPAPFGGQVIALFSNSPAITVPPYVTVPLDATSATFNFTAHSYGTLPATVTLSAAYANMTPVTTNVTVNPPLFSLQIAPGSVVGGSAATGSVILVNPAPSGGATLTFAVSDPNAATITPTTITIPSGQTLGTFTVNTNTLTAPETVNVSATWGASTVITPLQITVTASGGSGPCPGGMVLTSAGINSGYRLTTFACGFLPGSGKDVAGSAVTPDGSVWVTDFDSNLYRFQMDVDGQTVSSAQVFSVSRGVGLCTLNGRLFMGQIGNDTVVEINLNATNNTNLFKGNPVQLSGAPWGLTANPRDGHLLVTYGSSTTATISEIDPNTLIETKVVQGINFHLDGITVTPDGSIVYAAAYPNNVVAYYLTGSNQGMPALPAPLPLPGADGIILGSGTLSGYLFANCDPEVNPDGRIYQVELATGVITQIAGGGSDGDLIGYDNNGTLLVSQSDRLMRLTPPAGGRFGGTPSFTIVSRDDLVNANTTPYSTFSFSAPNTEGDSTQSATFDLEGLEGSILSGHMLRAGQMTWNNGAHFDLQFGLRSISGASNYVGSFGPVQSSTTLASPYPYSANWEITGGLLPDIQSELGNIYQVNLADAVSATCGGYTLTDTPQQNWPTAKNLLTVIAASSDLPSIVTGRCLDITVPGTDAPAAGSWDIFINQSVVASSLHPNGWNVEQDYLSAIGINYSGFYVTVPTGVAAGFGYEVRIAGGTPGPGRSGYFNVVTTDTGTAPLLLPLALNVNKVRGGNAVTLAITLDKPAPTGGATVSLTSAMPALATLPVSVTIPAGSTQATVSVTTTAVSSPNFVTLQAEYNGFRQTTLTVLDLNGNPPGAPTLTATGGPNVVHLSWPAVAGATSYNIYRSLVTGGPYTPWFIGVTSLAIDDTYVNAGTPYFYVGTAVNVYGESPYSKEVSATPTGPVVADPVIALAVSPASVTGGTPATATVTLQSPAPANGNGIVVALSSNNSAATVPATVTVPAQMTSATVTVTTIPVSANQTVTLSANDGGSSVTANLQVLAPKVVSVEITPSTVVGGDHASGIVTLSGPAPAGANVALSSSDPSVTVPGSVVVPAGRKTSSEFSVSTQAVTALKAVSIQATYNGNAYAQLTVVPLLASVSLNPSSVVGGNPSTGTVTLNETVSQNTTIMLSSDNGAAQTPGSVTVLTGQDNASFQVTTSTVSSPVTANIKATYAGVAVSAPLGIVPASGLLSLTVNPNSVLGGANSTGTVTLTAAAPVGGVLVTLTVPSGPATVPPVVLVPAGQSSVNFLVATNPVASSANATIQAALNSATRQASLAVLPATTQLLTPIADASVQAGSNANANYGTQSLLLTANLGATNNNSGVTYLKFDLTGVTTLPVSASLKLNVNTVSSPSSGISSVKIYGVSDTTWTETGITWNNASGLDTTNFLGTGTLLTLQPVPLLGGVATFDVTDYIKDHLGQLVTLQAIDETNDSLSLDFNSKEAASGQPQLVLVLPNNTGGTLADVPAPLWAENVIPTDSVPGGEAGPSSADCVNLASGVLENRPGPDLVAENFIGPSASYGRMYRTLRAQNGYGSPGLSVGWVDSYDFQVTPASGGASGALQLIYPNGAIETWTPTGTGTPQSFTVSTPGAPYLVTGWPGPQAGQWLQLMVTFADRSSWIFTPDNNTYTTYRLTQLASLVGTSNLLNNNGPAGTISINRDTNTHQLMSVQDSNGNALLQFAYNGAYISTITDNQGRSVNFTFGSSGGSTNLTQVSAVYIGNIAPTTPKWQYGYTAFNTHPFLTQVGIENPNSSATGLVQHPIYYDALGRVSNLIDANGNVRIYTYNPATMTTLVQVLDVMGNLIDQWTQKYNGKDEMTGIVDAYGKSTTVTYNDPANPYRADTLTNKNSQTDTLQHDGYGNTVSIVSPVAGGQVVTTYTFDYSQTPLGQLVQVQEGSKTPTKYSYYANNTVVNNIVQPNGLLKSVQTPVPGQSSAQQWREQDFTYTAMGDIQTITSPAPNSIAGQVVTRTYYYTSDPFVFGYSGPEMLGRPAAITVTGNPNTDAQGNPLVSHTSYRYYANGLVWEQADSLYGPNSPNHVITYYYNALKQPTSVVLPPTGQTGAGSAVITFSYPPSGPGKPATQVDYFDESNTDQRTVAPAYGNEAEIGMQGIKSAPEHESLAFDAQYRPHTLKDGNNNPAVNIQYDKAGNVSNVTPAFGPGFSLLNDADGNLTQFTDANGLNTNLTLAPDDSRVTDVTHQDGTSGVHMDYDSYGRVSRVVNSQAVLEYNYDDYDQLTDIYTTYTGQGTCHTSFRFNTDGTRSGMTITDAAGTVWNWIYVYDGLGRLSYVAFPWQNFGGTNAGGYAQYIYDLEGRLTIQHGPMVDAVYTYDARGQLTDLVNLYALPGSGNYTDLFDGKQHQVLSHYSSFKYDMYGHRLAMSSSIPGAGQIGNLSSNYSYSYDQDGRLTDETRVLLSTNLPIYEQQSYNNTFVTDAAGNKTVIRGAPATYNANNQLTTSGYTYDANGNAIGYAGVNGITYNADFQVTLLPGMLSANYDGLGQRAYKTNIKYPSIGTTYFLYDGDNVVAELDTNGHFIGGYGYGAGGLRQRYGVSMQGWYEYSYDPDGTLLQRHPGNTLRNGQPLLVLTEAIYDTKGQLYGDFASSDGKAYPVTDAVGYHGQWGNYTDTETQPTQNAGAMVCIGGGYYDPITGRYLTRASQDTNAYEEDDGDQYWLSSLAETEKGELNWSGFLHNPARWFFGETLTDLHDSTASFGDAAGRYDSGKASAAEVALKGGLAALQIVNVALPAAKGVTSLGRFGARLLAGTAEAAAEDEVIACVGKGCFLAGTPVTLANGQQIAIEKVKAGDLVLSRNEKTGKTEVKTVQNTTVHQVSKVIALSFADALTGQVVDTIVTTPNHPFYVQGVGFVEAGQLGIGTQIVTRAGPNLIVTGSAQQCQPEGYLVYNFEVDDDHTYFVGKASGGVWVHNATCLTFVQMQTLDLSNPAWRKATFSQQGLVYLLRDTTTDEILKVGQTTAKVSLRSGKPKFIGRFERYVAAANRHNRSLALDVFEVPFADRGKVEGALRKVLGKNPGTLIWDNAGKRLGRPGPGIP